MKCRKCREELSPFNLKQAFKNDNDTLCFEVDCSNSFCFEKNFLSEEAYLSLRNDHFYSQRSTFFKVFHTIFNWDKKKRKLEHVLYNQGLAHELKVAIVSTRRVGISWVGETLKAHYNYMFGDAFPITIKYEYSQNRAKQESIPLPDSWISVYDISPKRLLERGFDKVLCIERDLETLMKVLPVTFSASFTDYQKTTEMRKAKENWEIVYGKETQAINDPRFLKISLKDLNNYTHHSFTKVMDFLEFPKVGRAPIIPVAPIDRNWEAYSSILPQGHDIVPYLKNIEKAYRLNEFFVLDRLAETKEDIYKKAREAYEKAQRSLQLRRVLILGVGKDVGVHFSERIEKEFINEGIEVEYLSIYDVRNKIGLNDNEFQKYRNAEVMFPLSEVLKIVEKNPDLIFIGTTGFRWLRDVLHPVFYFHLEFKRPLTVFYPDVLFLYHEGIIRYFQNFFANHGMKRIPIHDSMFPAVDLDIFKPQEKIHLVKDIGITGIGGREDPDDLIHNVNEITLVPVLKLFKRDLEDYKKLGLHFFEGMITDKDYQDLLAKCETLVMFLPSGQHVSRRIVEAMACKTLCIIMIEDDMQERTLGQMGLVAGKHYLKFKKMEDLVHIQAGLKKQPELIQEITENAHDVVVQRHTYKARMETIIRYYKNFAADKVYKTVMDRA